MGPAPKPDAPPRMTRDAFRRWAEEQEGRWELVEGQPVAQAAERLGHVRLKGAIYRELVAALEAGGADCEALTDGATVEVGEDTDHIPDAVVSCGGSGDDDRIAAPNPVIVVEVLSPGSRARDMTVKLTNYFRVPGIAHYLIFSMDQRVVVHHQRQPDGTLRTAIAHGGNLDLAPPGITLDLDRIFARAGLVDDRQAERRVDGGRGR